MPHTQYTTNNIKSKYTCLTANSLYDCRMYGHTQYLVDCVKCSDRRLTTPHARGHSLTAAVDLSHHMFEGTHWQSTHHTTWLRALVDSRLTTPHVWGHLLTVDSLHHMFEGTCWQSTHYTTCLRALVDSQLTTPHVRGRSWTEPHNYDIP
jgi:hypothetical protein